MHGLFSFLQLTFTFLYQEFVRIANREKRKARDVETERKREKKKKKERGKKKRSRRRRDAMQHPYVREPFCRGSERGLPI
jgi:Flp pilus assembly protein TadB